MRQWEKFWSSASSLKRNSKWINPISFQPVCFFYYYFKCFPHFFSFPVTFWLTSVHCGLIWIAAAELNNQYPHDTKPKEIFCKTSQVLSKQQTQANTLAFGMQPTNRVTGWATNTDWFYLVYCSFNGKVFHTYVYHTGIFWKKPYQKFRGGSWLEEFKSLQ